ncbi:hypothetical protein [Mucilaginibacter sp.]|uniref:hypothetical protein n=1 Tax=Mucilaginibacter sp. TaxID=1882438 RepID=UPI0032636E01
MSTTTRNVLIIACAILLIGGISNIGYVELFQPCYYSVLTILLFILVRLLYLAAKDLRKEIRHEE